MVCRNKLSKRQLGETRVALQNEWNECEEVCSVSQVGSMAGWSGANTKANFVLATVHDSLSNHQQSDNDNSRQLLKIISIVIRQRYETRLSICCATRTYDSEFVVSTLLFVDRSSFPSLFFSVKTFNF